MADLNNLGYSTYILGTTKQVTECHNIILYNKDNVSFSGADRINVYNIESIISQLNSMGKGKRLSRESSDVPFRYTIDDYNSVEGFNVIIYIHNTNGTGVGYTEFINTQGQYRDINIYLDFQTKLEDGINIEVSNSLAYAADISDKIILGEDLSKYTSPERIVEEKKKRVDSPILFTSHLSSFGNPRVESNIYLGSMGTVIGRERSLCSFRMAREFDVDPYSVGFTNYQVGYYQGGDVSCYSWVGQKYSISSLSETNRFGSPIRHTDQNQGGFVSLKNVGSEYSIFTFSGRYAILCSQLSNGSPNLNTRWRIYDTVEESLISNSYGTYSFIDESDSHNRIVSMPLYMNYENIRSILPDVNDTFWDITTSNSIRILGRKEGWYIYIIDNGDAILFSGINGSLRIHKSEFHNVLLINNIYIGVLSQDKTYLTVYYTPGSSGKGKNWDSELYKANGNLARLTPYNDIFIYEDEEGSYKSFYDSGEIQVIDNNTSIDKTWFSNFTRNSYPRNITFPTISSIISACSGVIFYTTGRILNYL